MNVFGYTYRHTGLHRLDARVKIVLLLMFSITSGFMQSWWQLCILLAIACIGVVIARIPLHTLLRSTWGFAFIMIGAFVAFAFCTPGNIIVDLGALRVTEQGIDKGICFCLRLFAVLIACIALMNTTSALQIRRAVEWFLAPVPFIRERRVGLAVQLIFVFVPRVLDSIAETNEAQRARCIDANNNPARRIGFAVIPPIDSLFRQADEIANAIDARSWQG